MCLVEMPTDLPQTAVLVTAPTLAQKMVPLILRTYADEASRIIITHPHLLRQKTQHQALHNLSDLVVKITLGVTVILVTVGSLAPPPQALVPTQNLGLLMKLPALQQQHGHRLEQMQKGLPPLYTFLSLLQHHP
jgi:hypothetical protein